MKNNNKKIIIISSIIIIILVIIIGTTRALSNEILIVCDTIELLPNSETTCHVSGVSAQSISAVEFYIKSDDELDLNITSHNEEWETYNEEYGEIAMLSVNEFTNTFDLLTFKIASNENIGDYKIYLTNGKMVENNNYTIKNIDNKEITIKVVNELTNSASTQINSQNSLSSTSKPSNASSSSSAVENSNSNSNPSNSSESIISESKDQTQEITSNPKTGKEFIALVIIGLIALGYSVWYFKKTNTN